MHHSSLLNGGENEEKTEPRMRTVVRLLALLCKRIESIGRAASCDRDAYHLRTTDMPK